MTAIPVIKIKSSHPSQGDFVEINAEDFDASKHVLFDMPPPPVPLPPPPLPPAPVNPLDNLPRDWRLLESKKVRELAAATTGRMPEDKKQAVEMIEQALASKELK